MPLGWTVAPALTMGAGVAGAVALATAVVGDADPVTLEGWQEVTIAARTQMRANDRTMYSSYAVA